MFVQPSKVRKILIQFKMLHLISPLDLKNVFWKTSFLFGGFGQFSEDMFVLDRVERQRGRERRTGKEKDLIAVQD